jgi:hypothetical protein
MMTNPSTSDSSIRFVVFHRPGPSWQYGSDFREQLDVQDHVLHYQQLLQQSKLELGGPFLTPDLGGMMVTTKGITHDEIVTFATANPAVKSGLLIFEVHPWYTAMEQSA